MYLYNILVGSMVVIVIISIVVGRQCVGESVISSNPMAVGCGGNYLYQKAPLLGNSQTTWMESAFNTFFQGEQKIFFPKKLLQLKFCALIF